MYNLDLYAADLLLWCTLKCNLLYYSNVTCWESFYVYVFQYVTISLVVGCSPPLLILSENYRYVLLKHERYCEHFLEIMLHTCIH